MGLFGFGKNNNFKGMTFGASQYCPDCHVACEHKGDYWECPICRYSITDEEVEFGDGCSTLESSYEQENYETIYHDPSDDGIPEGCSACGGPYPDCCDSCPLFDD